MGNSAMKCFRGRGKVKVVLLSGEIAEFKEPVRASTVMRKYPQHIILHCSSAGNYGQRRRISVMKPEQALRRNQNYLVTPIQTAGNSKPFLDSWAFFGLSASKKLNPKLRQTTLRSGPNRRPWIQTVFDKIFKFPQSLPRLEDDDDARPLLGLNRPSVETKKNLQKNEASLHEWRPSLDSIPEYTTLSLSASFASYPRLDFR